MHCFRRGAIRLLSSAAYVPVRSRPVTTNVSRSMLAPRVTSQLPKYRWNSNEATTNGQKQEQDATNTAEQEVPASDPEDARVLESAVDSSADNSTLSSQTSRSTENARDIDAAVGANAGAPSSTLSDIMPNSPAAGGVWRPSLQFGRNRPTEQPEPKANLFIANLFYDTTAISLRRRMEEFGNVESCSIIFDDKGMSKGVAYVQFDNVESATKAKDAMHGSVFEGRNLVIRYARFNRRNPESVEPTKTIYIGSLPHDMTDRDINDMFVDLANVVDVRVAVDRRTGQLRGFCHAEFLDVESARMGMEVLRQLAPHGRKLKVSYSNSQRQMQAQRQMQTQQRSFDNGSEEA